MHILEAQLADSIMAAAVSSATRRTRSVIPEVGRVPEPSFGNTASSAYAYCCLSRRLLSMEDLVQVLNVVLVCLGALVLSSRSERRDVDFL